MSLSKETVEVKASQFSLSGRIAQGKEIHGVLSQQSQTDLKQHPLSHQREVMDAKPQS
jgi:hypothetical protein